MKRIKLFLAATITMGGLVGAMLVIPQHAWAYSGALPSVPNSFALVSKDAACQGLTQIDSNQDCSQGGSGFKDLLAQVVKILSFIAGAIAVIMVIVSGLRFVTSGGDAAKVSSAKNALAYAIVGLAVAGLAQVLVHFVLARV